MQYVPIETVETLDELASAVNLRLGEIVDDMHASSIGITVPRDNTESGYPTELTIQEVLMPLMGGATPASTAGLIDAGDILGGTDWTDLTDGGDSSLHHHDTHNDARYVNVTGDTMTGQLNIAANLDFVGNTRKLQWTATRYLTGENALELHDATAISATAPTTFFIGSAANQTLTLDLRRISGATDSRLGVIGVADNWWTGTVAGDLVLQATGAGNVLWLLAGNNMVKIETTGITQGIGGAGVDYTYTIDGQTNDYVETWDEGNDVMYTSDAWLFGNAARIYFEASGTTKGTESVYSANDGYMDYAANTQHRFTCGQGLNTVFLGDPGVIAVGNVGVDEPNAFLGGYEDVSGDNPTIYFGANAYYSAGWQRPDATEASCIFFLQGGNFYWYTGGPVGTAIMTLSSGGLLNIGADTTPTYRLEVDADNVAARVGTDPAVLAVGSIGSSEPNAFVGAYNDAGAGQSTIYFGQNCYYIWPGSWQEPDAADNTAMYLMQAGNHYWYTGTTAPGTLRMALLNAGHLKMISTYQMQFNDSGTYIYSSANSVLDIVADGTVAISGACTMDSTLGVTGVLTTSSGRIVNTTRITANTTLDGTHHNVFCDTDGGAFTVTLPAGVDGTEYRIINTGTAAKDVTVTPDGAELLLGANANLTLSDGDVLVIVYETTEGWY